MDTQILLTLLILPVCVIALSLLAGSDAPYVATQMDQIKQVLKTAGVKKGKKFYELGSGDGRVVFAACQLGAKGYGIEQSWLRVWYSRFMAHHLHLNAHFYHGNIFDRDYYSADVVYIYLLNRGVARLEPILKRQLKKGAVVITQTYHFPNWKPYKKVDNFYLYRA